MHSLPPGKRRSMCSIVRRACRGARDRARGTQEPSPRGLLGLLVGRSTHHPLVHLAGLQLAVLVVEPVDERDGDAVERLEQQGRLRLAMCSRLAPMQRSILVPPALLGLLLCACAGAQEAQKPAAARQEPFPPPAAPQMAAAPAPRTDEPPPVLRLPGDV